MTENQRSVIEGVIANMQGLASERSGEIVERLRDDARKLRGILPERAPARNPETSRIQTVPGFGKNNDTAYFQKKSRRGR